MSKLLLPYIVVDLCLCYGVSTRFSARLFVCPFHSFVFVFDQVGITLRDGSKDSQQLPVLILKTEHPSKGSGLVWTSYETGLVEGPFRPEHVERLALTHTLAVTGKVLAAALEAHPAFSKRLHYMKVKILHQVCAVVCA